MITTNVSWTTLFLGLLVLILIGWHVSDIDLSSALYPLNIREEKYELEYTTMVMYNEHGMINYTLVANQVKYFPEKQLTWFTQPVSTIFDENPIPNWIVKADQAKMTKNSILYLYGHVQVDSLKDMSQLKRMTTDNAVVNLITQDIYSDQAVTLYGIGLHATGLKMRGNLRNQTIELIEKVKISYESYNAQRVH